VNVIVQPDGVEVIEATTLAVEVATAVATVWVPATGVTVGGAAVFVT
jgi:hypothetical protein